ncbi:MAG: zinc transporter, family [Acidimicrobiaceae bacterium]|jgi:ZIP family zinc transporter|nr:zinc transporter, family [Acidimicrobiaceae bacterium]MDQ1366378.1 zinc transporter, family [Acidimicrobiaceae bacterium]MDQ1369390.1 zinc transporter, family [Acidimicrobiaceae bacterium]MDQ1376593.1 zinc transporter, family [Acidimicrobiaceae bacterium]MDQ1420529.1 zinc transporter, family [Acidimicrobiaceae bacterium]
MSSGNILILGAIAGLTIFLGLPVGRIRKPAPRLQAFLNASAIGVLLFLLWDVLSAGWEPVEAGLLSAKAGTASWPHFLGLAAIFASGLTIGLVTLVYYDRYMSAKAKRPTVPPLAPAAPAPAAAGMGPGAASVKELAPSLGAGALTRFRVGALSPAERLAFFIAVGIGLHNFGEGLAIGQSAAKGEVSLALMLIIGFGLHNATEGFGIVAPMAGEATRPSWGFLTVMGLIGGGPTFVGTLVGQSFVNNAIFVAFLALAAGSILYVIIQLLNVAAKLRQKEMLMWGILAGMFAGFATDLVLKAAGA